MASFSAFQHIAFEFYLNFAAHNFTALAQSHGSQKLD